MKITITYFIPMLFFFSFIGCNTGNKNNNIILPAKDSARLSNVPQHFNTTFLVPASNQEDTAVNEYLAEILKPIRANFKKLNVVIKWDSTVKKDLWETTEGGVATYFYLQGDLQKIITHQYGEMFQQLTEYYLFNKQISFVFDRVYKYNRPIVYDSAAMKTNHDDQVFDPGKSELIEERSYFKDGELIHQINNQDCGSPFTKEYLSDEQKELKLNFEKLKKLVKN